MYRGNGTGFALAYVLLGVVNAFVDIVKGAFELLLYVVRGTFGLAGLGIDMSRRGAFDQAIRGAVIPYLPVLVSKRQKLLRADAYGLVDNAPWSRELGHFLAKVLIPQLDGFEGYARRNLPYTAELVDGIVSEHQPLPPE